MASLPSDPVFEIVSEEVVHKRYVTMYNRAVKFPPTDGQAEVRAEGLGGGGRSSKRCFVLPAGTSSPCPHRLALHNYFLLQGPTYEYDVAGHPQADFHFSVTFPFHAGGPGGGSVTLLHEYAQVLWGAGGEGAMQRRSVGMAQSTGSVAPGPRILVLPSTLP